MHCFGISNHTPEQALVALQKRQVVSEMSEVAIVPAGTVLNTEKKPSRQILFILNTSDFYRNLKTLNSPRYEKAHVFVFASPLRIAELSSCVPLDFEANPAAKGLGYLLKKDINVAEYKSRVKKVTAPVARMHTRYLTLLTDSVKHGSLLNPLMTFLYTLPSSTHQTPVKEAVAIYLYKGGAWAKLEELLDGIKGVIINKRIRDRLKDILKSPEGDNMRAAFKELRAAKGEAKAPSWAQLAKRHTVTEYEMKYIKSVFDARLANKSSRGTALGAPAKKAA